MNLAGILADRAKRDCGHVALTLDDGRFFIVDRKQDTAISGGYNVYPREIDGKILKREIKPPESA
jgi:acyl-CoA synthetase (AMP-forming)/AMP-acid ligase II